MKEFPVALDTAKFVDRAYVWFNRAKIARAMRIGVFALLMLALILTQGRKEKSEPLQPVAVVLGILFVGVIITVLPSFLRRRGHIVWVSEPFCFGWVYFIRWYGEFEGTTHQAQKELECRSAFLRATCDPTTKRINLTQANEKALYLEAKLWKTEQTVTV